MPPGGKSGAAQVPRLTTLTIATTLQKHARYLAQLAAGAARLLVDSDGEDLAEEAETHTERHARMLQLAASKGAEVTETDAVRRRLDLWKTHRQTRAHAIIWSPSHPTTHCSFALGR